MLPIPIKNYSLKRKLIDIIEKLNKKQLKKLIKKYEINR